MKRFIPTLMFIIALGCLKAQAQFPALYYEEDSSVQSYCMINAPDSGHFAVGKYNNNGLLLRIGNNGILLWAKQYQIGTATVFNSVIMSFDSCLIITGNAAGTTLLMKTDLTGDTLWTKGFAPTYNSNGFNVIQTTDSGFAVCGYAYTPLFTTLMYVLKTDSQGNAIFSKTYFTDDENNFAYSIKETPDSCFIVAGQSNNPNQRAILMKISKLGDTIWSAEYTSGLYTNMFFDILEAPNGFILSGNFNFYPSLIKTDSIGNIEWAKNYDLEMSTNEFSVQPRLRLNSDNNILFAVRWENSGSFHNYLIVSDTLGVIDNTLSLQMINADIVESNDGNYLVIGNGPCWIFKTPVEIYWDHFGLYKLDSSFNYGLNVCIGDSWTNIDTISIFKQNLSLTVNDVNNPYSLHPQISSAQLTYLNQCVSMIGGSLNEENERYISIFPNPASDNISIQLPPNRGQIKNIDVYDCTGKKMLTKSNMVSEISISTLNSGLFFIVATTSKNELFTGSFIKE